MVNWRHLVRVGERPHAQILEGVPAALAAAWQLQLRPVSCVCQILMAAARAANFEACQVLKERRQLQISGLVKFQWQLRFGPAPIFYHA